MSNKYNILIVTEHYVTPLIFNTREELYSAWNSIKTHMFGSKEQPKVAYVLIDVDKRNNPIEKKYDVAFTILDKPIRDLEFTVRLRNCLIENGIISVKHLLQKTERELSLIDNLGKKSLAELMGFLRDFGLKLKDDQ